MTRFYKLIRVTVGIVAALAITYGSVAPATAVAPTAANWKAGKIIDDVIFYNNSAMTVEQIQQFLNSKVPTCDTWGTQPYGGTTRAAYSTSSGYPPPFTCLKDYYENTTTHENNLQGRPIPAGAKSAAQIIWDAAQQYTINPQSLIVLIQKEQGLITDDWPWTIQYRSATGYGCPDTAACDSTYYGFYNQVQNAAYQFRRYATYPGQYNHVAGQNNSVRYNPNAACGSSTVFIESTATAGLYNYTPYQPNQAALNNMYGSGDACSAYGNRNFWQYFNNWFGSTYGNDYDYQFISSTATALNYNPNSPGTIAINLKNTGNKTWYSDHNLPADQPQMRLIMAGYQDTPFADTTDPAWLGTRNQIMMTPDSVAPGETAIFTFKVVAPYKLGTTHHRLIPAVGGVFLKDVGMDVVLNTYAQDWTPIVTSIERRDFLPNQTANMHVVIRNNSGSTWYSDGNVPPGKESTRLVTVGYQDTPFADTTDPAWLGTRNQIMMTPSVVGPGQDATFDARFIAPINSGSSTISYYHFIISVGGVFSPDKGQVFKLATPAAILSYEGVTATNPPATMSPGQTAIVNFTIKNTGNVVWNDVSVSNSTVDLRLMMTNPAYRSSPFYNLADSNWLAPSQIKKSTGVTMPGENASFTFNWKAPAELGKYQEDFQPIVRGAFMPFGGHHFDTIVQ